MLSDVLIFVQDFFQSLLPQSTGRCFPTDSDQLEGCPLIQDAPCLSLVPGMLAGPARLSGTSALSTQEGWPWEVEGRAVGSCGAGAAGLLRAGGERSGRGRRRRTGARGGRASFCPQSGSPSPVFTDHLSPLPVMPVGRTDFTPAGEAAPDV